MRELQLSPEQYINFSRVVELQSGVGVLNCTPHEVIFRDGEVDITVFPCGATLRAFAREEVVEKRGETSIVQTVYEPTAQGLAELELIEATDPHVLPIGSFISAQTYKGRVYSMVPAAGFERVTVEQKRMDPHKFVVF